MGIIKYARLIPATVNPASASTDHIAILISLSFFFAVWRAKYTPRIPAERAIAEIVPKTIRRKLSDKGGAFCYESVRFSAGLTMIENTTDITNTVATTERAMPIGIGNISLISIFMPTKERTMESPILRKRKRFIMPASAK